MVTCKLCQKEVVSRGSNANNLSITSNQNTFLTMREVKECVLCKCQVNRQAALGRKKDVLAVQTSLSKAFCKGCTYDKKVSSETT